LNDLWTRHTRFNAESRDQWAGFSGHRVRVSKLLGSGSEPGRTRLCVLGAGNCNDLDLPSLLDAHREVHLVDLDPAALESGVERQGLAGNPRLFLHGGLDVTGMLEAFSRWSPLVPMAASELQALTEWPSSRVALALPGPFDLVASTCLLSQIVGNAFVALGANHPRFLDAVSAIRLGHLRLLGQLAAPGGEAVLISDVVSSDRFPALGSMPESSLPSLLKRRGLIHGMNPSEIVPLFRHDPWLRLQTASVRPIAPWRWTLHQRVYLVWALRWRRNPE
jgi:hypothetical protein